MIDKVKLAVAVLVMGAGIYGYYQLPVLMGQDVSILLRVGLLLVSLIAAVGIAATSAQGIAFIEFSKGSRTELRKMVWPSRQETAQTTMIVLVMVVIIAIFLWLVDMAVFKVIFDLLLGVDN
jgi:preprotein translocase subunit SecE